MEGKRRRDTDGLRLTLKAPRRASFMISLFILFPSLFHRNISDSIKCRKFKGKREKQKKNTERKFIIAITTITMISSELSKLYPVVGDQLGNSRVLQIRVLSVKKL